MLSTYPKGDLVRFIKQDIGWDSRVNKWKRDDSSGFRIVVLKVLRSSQNITTDFLQEITCHKVITYGRIVRCFGISQDPVTKNYVMVMDYAGKNLREFLETDHTKSFESRLSQLSSIASGLNCIHEEGLIHRDFHPGNILSRREPLIINPVCYITDLGLCRPANSEGGSGKIYGVLPYVAPEVLLKKKYAQTSDIYSLAMIAYEIFSGLPPFYGILHDQYLAEKICKGLRPNLVNTKIPQLLKDLIERCWDADPEKRPKANEIDKILSDWIWNDIKNKNSEFYWQ